MEIITRGIPIETIAESLGIGKETARKRLYRAGIEACDAFGNKRFYPEDSIQRIAHIPRGGASHK